MYTSKLAKPNMCMGMEGEQCTFALATRGGPAQVMGRATRCLFCRPEDLWPLCEDDAGKREAAMRVKARAAYEFLLASDDTPYATFVDEHKEFNAGASRGAAESDSDSDEESQHTDEEAVEDAGTPRRSMKRPFAALALGRLLGYAADFELLQFVYDLNLWSSIGSKKNLQLPTPMRHMLNVKGEAFSPHYWRSVHYALLDMVRQVGYPRIFFTIAPYEWSFPYHEWVRDEMEKLLKERLVLPVAETLHMVDVMVQAVKGLLLGHTGGHGKQAWTSNIFRVLDEQGQARQSPRARRHFR